MAINIFSSGSGKTPLRSGSGVNYQIDTGVGDKFFSSIQKANNKNYFSNQLTNVLRLPQKVPGLKNVEGLVSSNLVMPGNRPLPPRILNQRVLRGINENTIGVSLCINKKIDSIMDIFNVNIAIDLPLPTRLPPIDIKIPGGVITIDPNNLTSAEAIKALANNIKNGVIDMVSGIKDNILQTKDSLINQLETGLLNFKKFDLCANLNVDLTPRLQKLALKDPKILETIRSTNIEKSRINLTKETLSNVNQRVLPLAKKTKQQLVKNLTIVE